MEYIKKISYAKINNVRTILLLCVNDSINHQITDIKLNSTSLMEISQQYESCCIEIENPTIRGLSTEDIQFDTCELSNQNDLKDKFEENIMSSNTTRKSSKETIVTLESIGKQQNELDPSSSNMNLSKIGFQAIREIFSQVKASKEISSNNYKRVSSIGILSNNINQQDEDDSIRATRKKSNEINSRRKITEV